MITFEHASELLAVEYLNGLYVREGIYHEINDGYISDIGRDNNA